MRLQFFFWFVLFCFIKKRIFFLKKKIPIQEVEQFLFYPHEAISCNSCYKEVLILDLFSIVVFGVSHMNHNSFFLYLWKSRFLKKKVEQNKRKKRDGYKYLDLLEKVLEFLAVDIWRKKERKKNTNQFLNNLELIRNFF